MAIRRPAGVSKSREIGIARFTDGKWKSGWYFGDELGMMLQLGALHRLG